MQEGTRESPAPHKKRTVSRKPSTITKSGLGTHTVMCKEANEKCHVLRLGMSTFSWCPQCHALANLVWRRGSTRPPTGAGVHCPPGSPSLHWPWHREGTNCLPKVFKQKVIKEISKEMWWKGKECLLGKCLQQDKHLWASHPQVATVNQPMSPQARRQGTRVLPTEDRGWERKRKTPPPSHPSSWNKSAWYSIIIQYNYYTIPDNWDMITESWSLYHFTSQTIPFFLQSKRMVSWHLELLMSTSRVAISVIFVFIYLFIHACIG